MPAEVVVEGTVVVLAVIGVVGAAWALVRVQRDRLEAHLKGELSTTTSRV